MLPPHPSRSPTNVTVIQPQLNRIFNSAMESDSIFVMDIVKRVGGEAFRGIGSLVDVEGCTDMSASKWVEAFHGLRCIVFDLPHVIATVPRALVDVEIVSSDMFIEVPRTAAALFKVTILPLFTVLSKRVYLLTKLTANDDQHYWKREKRKG
ncbi:hypothetical protein HPP92_023854 [Vanilla planifolia]|uniref:O-methyltransferase C-terminal domain-containing protein n=1 Tax=Vanilla planifolia TaxID=51239 RepID=A0A835PN41_VANPL|nr:hypothetical protein HPP92_023854 [Vanilla planifolia]